MLTLGVLNGTICHESILQNKSNTQMAINSKQTHPGCVLVCTSWSAWQNQHGTLTQKHRHSHVHVFVTFVCVTAQQKQ